MVCFSLFCSSILAQIPLGNFLKLNTLELNPGAKRFAILRQSHDSVDVLAFSSKSRIASLIRITRSSGPVFISRIHLPFGLSNLVRVRKEADSEFVFLSAHKNLMGILKQEGKAEFNVTATFKLSNFPSELVSADIDNDGFIEAMAYGANFPGVMVVDYKNHSWRNKTFERGRNFSTAVLCDVNNDGSADFTGFDLKSGTLDFFYNNTRGEFSLVRSLSYAHYPEQLAAADMNGDGYPDILYITSTDLEILFGDNIHSYNAKKSVHLPAEFASYVIGDFNDDGKEDIAFAGVNPQEAVILFQKENCNFYPPVPYLTQDEIEDMRVFYTGGKASLAVLSDKDNFLTISRLENRAGEFSFPFASSGDRLLEPRSYSEKLLFAFVDISKNAMPVVASAGKGKYIYYSIPLFGQFVPGFYDICKDNRADFFLMDYSRQNVQYIALDLKSGKTTRNFYRYDGRLLDAEILRLSQNDKKLSLITRMHQNVKQTLTNYEKQGAKPVEFALNIPGCRFGKALSTKLTLFSTDNGGEYQLLSWVPGAKITTLLFRNTSSNENKPAGFFTGDIFCEKKSRILSIFTNGDEYRYCLSGGNDRSGKIRNVKGGSELPELTTASILSSSPDKAGFVLLQSSKGKSVYQLDFRQSSAAVLRRVLSDVVPASMIMKHLGRDEDYIFVTQKDGNGILAKKLN